MLKIRLSTGSFLLVLAILFVLVTPLSAHPAHPISQQCLDLMLGKTITVNPNAPTIRFAAPVDMGVFYGDSLTVTVQIENAPPNFAGWDLWVNGTQYLTEGESAAVKTGPGIFALCATMYDANNADIGNADFITVTVVQPGPGTPTSVPGAALSSVAPSAPAEDNNNTPTIVLLAVSAFLAALAGWWVGKRLPKRRSRRR